MKRRGSRLRRRYGRAAHAPFLVAKTYDVVTEESSREGDFAESGYDFEDTPMTLRDAVREVKNLGYIDEAQAHKTMLRFYEADGDTDYRTGDVTTHALHIRGSEKSIRRLKAVLQGEGVRFH